MKDLENKILETTSDVKGFLKKKEVEKPTIEAQKPQPTFAQVEEPAANLDTLAVYGKPKAYEFRWCQEGRVSNGRSGSWIVVDRNHPDFKGLRIEIDHTPDQTFFKYRDLILCCVRKETADKKRLLLRERTKAKSQEVSGKYRENVGKIQKSLGNQSEAIRLMDTLDKEE